MNKILLLGSTGFMGRNIWKWFVGNKEYLFSAPERSSFNLTIPDDVKNMMLEIKPEIVIQAAANTSGAKEIVERPYLHVTDNAVMNSLLLREAYESNVKHFIFLSCGVMYQPGNILRKEIDFCESDEINQNYYGVGWTKVYIEKMCEFYSRLGMKCTVIRHSNTYGPHDKFDLEKSHVFGATIRKVMDAKEEIVVWGEGSTERDLIYVDDVVRFIDIVIKNQQNSFEIVNVSAGYSISVKDLVEKIVRVSGKNLRIKYDISKPFISTKLALDNSKAYKLFGWRPEVDLEEGIKRTLEWYKHSVIRR